MINKMHIYDYRLLNDIDDYGINGISDIKGKIKLSINLLNQQIDDNSLYKTAQYIALTLDKDISDKYIIEYDEMLLKVLYVNKMGRYKQVYLCNVNG